MGRSPTPLPPTPPKRPELLAPAGDWDAMRAAVANGADAVYFGLTRYSARHRAANFAVDQLAEVMAYLHSHNVRGYVTFNTLIFSDELPDAAALAVAIAQAGADAAIVQDLGLARLIHRMAPSLALHASTQMTLTEPRGIELARRLGIRRVILARELSIDQIRRIRQATDVPLETFVHGAMCMSYSGQCLASEALWGRSANRGLCGQACRMPYRLMVRGKARDLGDKAYLLSTKDLAAFDRIADLVRIGVAGFKIEGRLKPAHYVAAATQVYRAAIDAAMAGRTFSLSGQQQLDLAQSFSRGFTHGFLDGPDHLDLVHGRFPKSRGVCVGTVTGKTARGIIIDTATAAGGETTRRRLLKPGDGVVFDNGRLDEDEQGGRVFRVDPAARRGTALVLTFGEDAVNLAAVAVGSTAWKTDDPRLRRELEKSYARDLVERRVPLAVRVLASAGRPLRIFVSDPDGRRAEVSWDKPLEAALKRPLTIEVLREQFGRLGDTPFELGHAQLLDAQGRGPAESVMVPKSVLNDLRRQAVQALMESRAAASHHAVAEPDALAAMRAAVAATPAHGHDSADAGPLLHVLARRPDQLDALLEPSPPGAARRPATVYLDFQDPRQHAAAVARCREAGVCLGIATLRIAKPGEEEDFEAIAACGPDVVLVRNLAGASFFRERMPDVPLVGDYSLNMANEISAAVLAEWGLARMTTSLDLSEAQLAAMLALAPAAWFEVPLHLHVPLLHMQHCLFAAHLAESHDERGCGRPCTRADVALRGRVGAEHPLAADARCRNTLFCGRAQSAVTLVPEMRRRGVRHWRLELLRETPRQAAALLDLYARVLSGDLDPEAAWQQLEKMHPAGVTRGTWDFQ